MAYFVSGYRETRDCGCAYKPLSGGPCSAQWGRKGIVVTCRDFAGAAIEVQILERWRRPKKGRSFCVERGSKWVEVEVEVSRISMNFEFFCARFQWPGCSQCEHSEYQRLRIEFVRWMQTPWWCLGTNSALIAKGLKGLVFFCPNSNAEGQQPNWNSLYHYTVKVVSSQQAGALMCFVSSSNSEIRCHKSTT